MRNDWTGRSEVSVFRDEVSVYLVMRSALKFQVDFRKLCCQMSSRRETAMTASENGSSGQISKPQPHANIIHSKSTLYLQK